jgi:hypothetical protein
MDGESAVNCQDCTFSLSTAPTLSSASSISSALIDCRGEGQVCFTHCDLRADILAMGQDEIESEERARIQLSFVNCLTKDGPIGVTTSSSVNHVSWGNTSINEDEMDCD